jgi:hypothetical protein
VQGLEGRCGHCAPVVRRPPRPLLAEGECSGSVGLYHSRAGCVEGSSAAASARTATGVPKCAAPASSLSIELSIAP